MITVDLTRMSEKQKEFMRAKSRYVGYGGARGGGKSWAMRTKFILLAMHYPRIRILLLRRTFPELRENHIRPLSMILHGLARYNESKKEFIFPNGSIIKLGYCQSENDVTQYQGQEYDILGIEEATQFTEYQFTTLKACVRGTNGYPKRIYITCNPGGVGHAWVKRLFVDKRYHEGEEAGEYTFIFAYVRDNTVLMENDPDYLKTLESLPEGLRKAWLDGNWDTLAGQYFSEFDRSVHVVDAFEIPSHWYRYRAIDYGLDCLACVWVAVSDIGECYVYREYAQSNKTISEGAKDIVELSKDESIRETIAPSDLWARSQESGRSKADIFAESGLPLVKGNNNREAGWLAVKELLKIVDKDGKDSRLKFFTSCPTIVEHLTTLQIDSKHPTDCATMPHDITHLPDALRYYAAMYTSCPKPQEKPLTDGDMYKRKILKVKK